MLDTLITHHKKQLANAQSVLDADGNLFSHPMREMARLEAAREREFIRTLEAAQAILGRGKKYRHLQRGSTYSVLGQGLAQCASPIEDNDAVVVYRDDQGRFFARHVDEFHDGRFEEIAEEPQKYVFAAGGHLLPCTLSSEQFLDLCKTGDIEFTDKQDYGTGLRGRYQLMGSEQYSDRPIQLNLRGKA